VTVCSVTAWITNWKALLIQKKSVLTKGYILARLYVGLVRSQ
jgi:hypothetical protein